MVVDKADLPAPACGVAWGQRVRRYSNIEAQWQTNGDPKGTAIPSCKLSFWLQEESDVNAGGRDAV